MPLKTPSNEVNTIILVITILLTFVSIKTLISEYGLYSLLDYSEIGANMRSKGISTYSQIILSLSNIIVNLTYILTIIFINNIINDIKNPRFFTFTVVIIKELERQQKLLHQEQW